MKKFLLIITLILATYSMFGRPANKTPFKVVQPNGDSITIIQYGDEYGIWYETLDGYVVEKNSSNYWVYVNTTASSNLVLTNQIVNNVSSPTEINLTNVFSAIANYRENIYNLLNNDSIFNPDIEDIETLQGINQGYTYNTEQARVPAKNKGEINVLTILIQFQDLKFQNPSSVKNFFTNLMNKSNFKHPSNPNVATGCVREYWEEVSYGQLSINPIVVGPYTAEYGIEYYKTSRNDDDQSLNASKTKKLVKEAIKKAAKEGNMQYFDNDNNGFVDFVHIVFAGTMYDIWPHRSNVYGILRDGVWISKYIITPEIEDNTYASIGTICHEMGHAFGAPDFYDRDGRGNGGDFAGTYTWDLMSDGNYNNCGESPAHPNPYIKTEIFKWATATELTGNNREYKLRPSELDGNSIYKLSTSTPNEYYLFENRQDKNLRGTGLLVYHINAGIENVDRSKINIKHRQNLYIVDANNHITKPTGSVASYGNMDSPNVTFRSTDSENMYFTSESSPSNCDWDENPTQNKNVCFISEEDIDGEMCVKFVLNPEIEGPDVLCDSAIYSLKHVPSNATIEWTYTRPSGLLATSVPLKIGSGQGTKAVYYKRGYNLVNDIIDDPIEVPDYPFVPAPASARGFVEKPYSGFVTIKAKVTLNGNTFTLSKEIYMPERVVINDVNLGSLGVWYVGGMNSITLRTPTDETILEDIRWDVEYPNGSTQTAYGSSVVVRPDSKGTLTVTATYLNGCGDEYESYTKTFSIVSVFNITYTNPASGSVEINVMNGDASDESSMRTMSANSQPTPYMGAYRVELWHDVYGKVREMDVPENNPTVTMSLDGLNSGVYVLRLIIDNQVVEASQLIVK